MSVTAEVRHRVGSVQLEVNLEVADGEVLAVLGPNGAGKTTLLRALAGLTPIDEGRIEIGGAVVDEPSAGVFVSPSARSVGVGFQDYALFPTLSVLENVAFGLRARGTPRHAARAAAAGWLERVGLADRAADRPGVLSGGQAQRVALARALATDPELLLLDEPLAALDVTTRATVRRELGRHLGEFGGPTIVVTHDPVDAMVLAQRVAIIEDGRIAQIGTLAQITAHPRSRYVADLVGVNLVRGTVGGGVLTTDSGVAVVIADAPDGDSWATIRPHSLVLASHRAEGTSVSNSWKAVIAGVDRFGDRVRVQLEGPLPLIAEITAASFHDMGFAPGDTVHASAKATDIEVYPA